METIQLCLVVFLILYSNISSRAEITQGSSNFTCHESEEEIDFRKVCDGIFDCADHSDEGQCDNEAVLLYYIYESNAETNEFRKLSTTNVELNLSGAYLRNNNEFSTLVNTNPIEIKYVFNSYYAEVKCKDPSTFVTNAHIISNGSQIYTFYRQDNSNYRNEMTRTGVSKHIDTQITEKVTSLALDWVMSHIYYISGSRIKVCDFYMVICIDLQSKFIKNPSLLTISSEHGFLFWIEEKANSQFYLFKYFLDGNSKATRLSHELKYPKWITIDSAKERVYWMEVGGSSSAYIRSITFEGTDLEATELPGTSTWSNTSTTSTSFAVFNDRIYWTDISGIRIETCSAMDCKNATTFKTISTNAEGLQQTINPEEYDHYDGRYRHYQTTKCIMYKLGSLTMDHRSSLRDNTRHNTCINSSCSHLCLPDPESLFKCYCENSSIPLPTKQNSGYCNGMTLIVTYHNYIYIVGLWTRLTYAPIIHKQIISMSSIAAVCYDSITESVIFTEIGQQNIYSWIPRTRELTLISEEGPGTINSIEFDYYGNNLYWTDPTSFTIKVMNLKTSTKTDIVQGNSSYYPMELALVSKNGYMVISFIKNNSTTVIERMSMDGASNSRKVIYEDQEIAEPGEVVLHYMKEMQELCLLDRQRNEIRYYVNRDSVFTDLQNTNEVGKMESITSSGDYFIWSEDNLEIRRAKMIDYKISTEVQKISLGLEKQEKSVLKMTSAVKLNVVSRSAKCLQNNGGCEELCLVSDSFNKFTCACTRNKKLVNGNACRNFHDVQPQETNSTRRWNEAQTTQTESTCIKSCPSCLVEQSISSTSSVSLSPTSTPRKEIISIRPNEVICPVCRPTATSEYNAFHFLNSALTAVLGALFGSTLGYVIGKRLQAPGCMFTCTRSLNPENGNLELSQMNAESTTALYPNTKDSS